METTRATKMSQISPGEEEIYGCFKCGAINGEREGYCCTECGAEESILTFLNALDIINDMYLRETLDETLIDREAIDDLF